MALVQEKKGVDIGSNFNFGSLMLWVFVVLAIIAGGVGIAKWFQHRQEKKRKHHKCKPMLILHKN